MDFVIENEQEQKQIKEKIYKKPDEKMKFNSRRRKGKRMEKVKKIKVFKRTEKDEKKWNSIRKKIIMKKLMK